MKTRTGPRTQEFERRLHKARNQVWRTVARTDAELATLEPHPAGSPWEDAANEAAASLLAQIEGRERHLLDEIHAAQARLAAGVFGTCERCAKPIPLTRLRALPTARLCIACERHAERLVHAGSDGIRARRDGERRR